MSRSSEGQQWKRAGLTNMYSNIFEKFLVVGAACAQHVLASLDPRALRDEAFGKLLEICRRSLTGCNPGRRRPVVNYCWLDETGG